MPNAGQIDTALGLRDGLGGWGIQRATETIVVSIDNREIS